MRQQAPARTGAAVALAEDYLAVRAEPRHLPGIVELARESYGDSYSKREFYSVERLREALDDGRMVSYVLVSPASVVVGHFAYFRAPGVTDVIELGAAMVHPEHRHQKLGCLQQLMEADCRNRSVTPSIVTTSLVTSHLRGQRAADRVTAMALAVSMHDRAEFVGIGEAAGGRLAQRETLIHAVHLARPVAPVRLHVPARHASLTRRLFDHLSIPIDVVLGAVDLPAQSLIDVRTRPEFQLATVDVTRPGRDLADALAGAMDRLESDVWKTVYVRLPGDLPHSPEFEDTARSSGLFFNGWFVESSRRWWLQYSRLNGQPFEFEHVHVVVPLAEELKSHVAGCHRETLR